MRIDMNEKTFENRRLGLLNTVLGESITSLIENQNTIEIIANPDGKLWVESFERGKFFTGIMLFPNQIANIIKVVASYSNKVVNYSCPELSCKFPYGRLRFQGWVEPSVDSPTFTIRKHIERAISIDDYVAYGRLCEVEADFLRHAIKARSNILIAGGTGSGKTTLANALIYELKDTNDRIIILEDVPELSCNAPDCVRLYASPSKDMRALVKGVLHMRPDRIIVGEVRDSAALELLKAWNTGHPGGIATIHANSPEASLLRLEDLAKEKSNFCPKRLIAEAIDVIIFMQRDEKILCKVTSINECVYNKDGEYELYSVL